MKVISFDIFDTCLVRKCGNPNAVYYLLGKRLFPGDNTKAMEFATQRRFYAEERARNAYGTKYPTLLQIYQCIGLPYMQLSANALTSAEEELERELLCGVDVLRIKIKEYRLKGYKIIFISDMYLSSNFLKEVLKRENLMNDCDSIYVSCECNCSKYDGALYNYVGNELSIKHWHHYGDNMYSDVKMARKAGLYPHHIKHEYNRYESLWQENKSEFSAEALLAGCSRSVRLSKGYTHAQTLAADVITTTYLPFVAWILRKTKEAGINKILFFARDSLLFHQIAQVLEKREKTGIEMHYFYVSRLSLYLPSLYNCELANFKDCDNECKSLSWKQFKYEFSVEDYPDDFENVEQALGNIDFIDFIKNKSKDSRKLFLRYIEQLGISKEDKVGIVDLGWTGSGRKVFSKIFQKEGFLAPTTYYFGTLRDRVLSSYGDYVSYKYLENETCHDTIPSVFICENYFSITSDNTTIGYMDKDGIVIPRFNQCTIPEWQRNLSLINNNSVLDLVKEIIHFVDVRQMECLSEIGALSWHVLDSKPTHKDYLVFKDIESEHFGQKCQMFPRTHILQYLFLMVLGKATTYWPEMSLVGNAFFASSNISIYHWLKKLHRQIDIIVHCF